ncbi:MAG: outer membrane protein assembly factor BamA [Rubricoccaceae bacterium]|nr:outer membrane protein assembly factor BamA [Rubricoccaceae bacterium]
MTRPLRFVLPALVALLPLGARAQPEAAARYEILALDVEGGSETTSDDFVRQYSGLRVGQEVSLPYSPAIAEATKKLYETGFFSDVEIVADRLLGDGVYLLVRVQEEPRLNQYTLENVSGGARDDLEDEIPLLRGRPVRPSDVGRTIHAIERYYEGKGYRGVSVDVTREVADGNRVDLTFTVDRGQRLEVEEVTFVGNEVFSDGTLRKRLKNTPEDRWWRFWSRATFDEEGFDEDLQTLVRFYNDRGYYDARVVRDTVWVREEPSPGIVVQVAVHEGSRYVIRDILFEGNTVFTDAQLREALGFERGDVYDRSRLEENLFYTAEHRDVASLYTDRGYLRFNVIETVEEAPGDSLDLLFEIEEGEVYTFGEVAIRGNTRTRDDVIRRELRTVPGQVYSRQAVERTVRELLQLNYFDQTSLGGGPEMAVDDEDRSVGLTYNLVEASSDQLELSGGWGGSLGLQLSARVTFNNFAAQDLFKGSAWRPLPSGRGQQLSLGVVTYGTRSQQFSLSFTEPWFRGRRTPVGFSVSYLRYNFGTDLSSFSSRVFYRQSLRWPDDFFQTGTDLGYRLYRVFDDDGQGALGLPTGTSQELTVRQTLSRNSLDNPIFPQAGSSLSVGVTVAPPIPGFLQYHKWELDNQWYAPVVGKLSLSFRSQFGYIGSFTGDDVQFQRFLVGGSPLETQGRSVGFGKDLVFLRGYPVQSISPIQNGEAVGGRILNKYQAELRLFALQSPQLSFAPYLFADAANTWDSFRDYDPGRLFRSAGLGARVLLPFLGMVDVNYGYQIDAFVDPATGEVAEPSWRFQFSLGGQ